MCLKYKGKWILIFVILFLSGCTGRSMPDSIIGTWVSDHPQYQKCIIKIGNGHIAFGDPEGNVSEFEIEQVSTKKVDRGLTVTIDYMDSENTSLTIGLLFSSANDGYLLIKNQQEVMWKRQN